LTVEQAVEIEIVAARMAVELREAGRRQICSGEFGECAGCGYENFWGSEVTEVDFSHLSFQAGYLAAHINEVEWPL
jgi:hypothetical protein